MGSERTVEEEDLDICLYDVFHVCSQDFNGDFFRSYAPETHVIVYNGGVGTVGFGGFSAKDVADTEMGALEGFAEVGALCGFS